MTIALILGSTWTILVLVGMVVHTVVSEIVVDRRNRIASKARSDREIEAVRSSVVKRFDIYND
jgi:uncharacterized membrane protein